jgi:hypothetical protein
MAWPDWPKDDAKGLARYVLPEVGERLRLDIGRDDALKKGDRLAVARAVYEALAKLDLNYARELYHPDEMVQRIREPDVMLAGGGNSTCLDLALLFAGACLGQELLPLVVIVDGHAFAAVSVVDDPRNPGSYGRIERDGAWVKEGFLEPQDVYAQLVVENGNYVPIECTGFAKSSTMPQDVPEGQGRKNGRLDFLAAVAAARAQLKARPFRFAVDPAVLQRVKKYPAHQPSTRNAPEDLRVRLAAIFDQHRLFGGRNTELEALDGFLKTRGSGYALVTGGSGSGKTALLANWIRTLEARDDVSVAYHFINRQQRLASERDFLRTLCQQIKVLRGQGREVPSELEDLQALYLRLMDEGPSGRRLVLVIDGIDEAEGWAPKFPFPLRPDMHVVISARAMAGRDWPAQLEFAGKPELFELGALNEEAIKDLLRSGGAAASAFAGDAAFVGKLHERSKGDPFYLQFLVKDIEAGQIRSQADLEKQPVGVTEYLTRWWEDVEPGVEQESVRDLLGYLLVAKGALTRTDLADLSKDDKLDSFNIGRAIKRVDRYLVGSDETGYDLCHPRFRDHLVKNIVTPNDQVPYRNRLIDFCAGWKKSKNRYAIECGARHLIDAIEKTAPEDRGELLARLTGLLTDSKFQDLYMAPGGDLGVLKLGGDFRSLEEDMKDALQLAVDSGGSSVGNGVLALALGLVAARRAWLHPERIFELAEAGKLLEAEHRLALFDAEPNWRQAALAGIAWSALGRDTAAARTFLRRHAVELDRDRAALPLLVDRVHAASGDAPPPKLELPYWHPGIPDPVSEYEGRTIVLRVGGGRVNVSGTLETRHEAIEGRQGVSYVAENDSPYLVALASSQRAVGITLLKEYISIHGANPYREYRNRALWAVLGAVLCHPEPALVIDLLRTLVSMALKPGAADYREALLLAIEALAARAGDAPSKAQVEERVKEARAAADSLWPGRTRADAWGHHCRRFAALAEAHALALADPLRASECLYRAHQLPFGYAGFQTPASLTLAEANRICRPAAAPSITAALFAARRSAHNIQEPSFCAASTARVNAMRNRWWRGDGQLADLPALVDRFKDAAAAAEFAPICIVGEPYEERVDKRVDNPQMLQIPSEIRAADTLDKIARHICQRPVAEVARLNPGPDPTTPLPQGTEVNLPDSAFAPLLAARLAAEALAQREQLGSESARLIRKLVPIAAANPTALDTVLARLMLADPDLSSDLLARARMTAPSDWMVEPVPLANVEA